jgi:threonine dehydrogenase-like Zn-dependent dehydrogenase
MITNLQFHPRIEAPAATMQAAVLVAPRRIEIQEVKTPIPAPDQVLVQIEGCGVCASSLPLWEGREWFQYPCTPGQPGHEAWGTVAAVGDKVHTVAPGDRIAMLAYHGYAQYDVAPATAVVKLPTALEGQPFPAEPLACALNVFTRSQVKPGQQVAIIGIGFLGAVLTSLARQAGAEVIAISRRPFALALARELGAAHTIAMEDHWEIIEQVKHLTNGAGCECVIEAIGQQWPLDLASELTQIRGRLVVAGYHQDGPRQVNMQLWNWRGLDVINAHERDEHVYVAGMAAAVIAVSSGALTPAPLYTHRFALNDLGDAFETLITRPPGFLKALVMME